MGGLRVTENNPVLAAVHGVTGQCFFGLMVAVAVVTGRPWVEAQEGRPDTFRYRRRALATLGMLIVLVPLGVIVRHFGSHMAIGGHLLLALMVLGHALTLVIKVERTKRDTPELLPSARALGGTIVFQVLFGLAALILLWPLDPSRSSYDALQVLIRTGHQANGALLIGAATVLTLRAYRAFSPSAKPSDGALPLPPRDLEVVA
jgi:cytochrome c oxidase assembly protein subunit 15